MPKVKAGAETIDKQQLNDELDRVIEIEYKPEPSWLRGSYDERDRNIRYEYNRLVKVRGYSEARSKLILARLIGRTVAAIEKILY
jgi:hypothetical protein